MAAHQFSTVCLAFALVLPLNFSGASPQGILTDDEAVYYYKVPLRPKTRDDLATHLRASLSDHEPIRLRISLLINETARGVYRRGTITVKKGTLSGLRDVTQRSINHVRRGQPVKVIYLAWSSVISTFRFDAAVNGLRSIGLIRIAFDPVVATAVVQGSRLIEFHPPLLKTRVSVTPTIQDTFPRTYERLVSELKDISEASLAKFVETTAKRAILASLETIGNEVPLWDDETSNMV